MNDTPVPIRPGIEPSLDVAREMRDYAWAQIENYIKEHGEPPASIAVALIGPDRADAFSQANTWTPTNENTSRLHACSIAATLFLNRALGN
jgi:hypothetical protein